MKNTVKRRSKSKKNRRSHLATAKVKKKKSYMRTAVMMKRRAMTI